MKHGNSGVDILPVVLFVPGDQQDTPPDWLLKLAERRAGKGQLQWQPYAVTAEHAALLTAHMATRPEKPGVPIQPPADGWSGFSFWC